MKLLRRPVNPLSSDPPHGHYPSPSKARTAQEIAAYGVHARDMYSHLQRYFGAYHHSCESRRRKGWID